MKLAVKIVDWTQSISVNGRKFDKRCSAAEVAGLWYVGTGVLIEQEGLDDVFVPLGNVLCIRADGKLTSEDWSGDAASKPLNMAAVPPKSVSAAISEYVNAPPAVFKGKPAAIEPESTPVDKPPEPAPEPTSGGFLRKKPKPKNTSK